VIPGEVASLNPISARPLVEWFIQAHQPDPQEALPGCLSGIMLLPCRKCGSAAILIIKLDCPADHAPCRAAQTNDTQKAVRLNVSQGFAHHYDRLPAYILLTLTRILRLNQGLADTALTRCLHDFQRGTRMYAKLTRTFVETQVCPERGQIIIRDTEIKGLGLRLTPNCKSFIVERRVNGTQHRVTLEHFPSLSVEAARKEAQRLLSDMAAGVDPTIPPVKPPTLEEVLDRYLQERSMKPETKRTYRSLVERLLPDWLRLPINSISREMILTRHQGLLRPTRCGTDNKSFANSTMQVLRTLINFAACKYGLEPDNPTDALKYRWYRQEARQGTIPDAKLPCFYRAVMAQESKIARDFILFLLFSGLRRNEAARLKWTDINFDARTLTVEGEHNKSNRVHVLPLTEMLTAILQSRLLAEAEYVFPGRYDGHLNEPRAPLAQLRQQMGWHWLLHDLRRTALSAGEKAGVPFLALQKIANHGVRPLLPVVARALPMCFPKRGSTVAYLKEVAGSGPVLTSG
jgi:integrase